MPLTQADYDGIGRLIRENTDKYIVPQVMKKVNAALKVLPPGGGASPAQVADELARRLKA